VAFTMPVVSLMRVSGADCCRRHNPATCFRIQPTT
jgi:hypothetical protein